MDIVKYFFKVQTYLADFQIKDTEFLLKIVSGAYVDCLKNIDEYAPLDDSEIDEE
jgi:hypothetical protein